MKKHQILTRTFTALTVPLLLCSCYVGSYTNPYYVSLNRQKENHYYVPSVVNAPMLANKNDISLSAAYGITEQDYGGSFQASYLVGKHVGLMANYSKYTNDEFADELSFQNHFEFGAGYVNKLSDHWLFETYGGLGSGKTENLHETGNSTVKSKNYFLQPTIAFGSMDQVLQVGFVSRFNMVKFDVGDTSFNNDREPFVTDQMKMIAENPSHVFWEPGIILRGGWKWIGLQASYQFSADLSSSSMQRSSNNFSIGVICRLNTTKKK